MRIRAILLIIFALFYTKTSMAQDLKLSEYAAISILTCEPGTDLYASFGHSAIRVKDPLLGLDIIYNYGIFDFYAPNFYTNFVKGKLTYSLGRQYFNDFLFEYEREERDVKEQLLSLDAVSKDRFFNFLESNFKPENRDYAYDFFYNNCATKIRDLIEDPTILPLITKLHKPQNDSSTFRTLLKENLGPNEWSMLGINMLLGSKIDKKIKFKDYQFLPFYLSEQLSNYQINGSPLVKEERMAYKAIEKASIEPELWKTPAFWSLFIFLITITISLYGLFAGVPARYLDVVLFGCTGLVSLLLMGLWFFSDHDPIKQNYNLLWASPLAWLLLFSKYTNTGIFNSTLSKLMVLSLISTAFIHILGIQKFDLLFFPIIAALLIRSLPLWRRNESDK